MAATAAPAFWALLRPDDIIHSSPAIVAAANTAETVTPTAPSSVRRLMSDLKSLIFSAHSRSYRPRRVWAIPKLLISLACSRFSSRYSRYVSRRLRRTCSTEYRWSATLARRAAIHAGT